MTAASGPATDVRTVHVVLPGDIDDPRTPSGGNRYDRRVCQGLADGGWAVHELAVAAAWPRPDATGHAALAAVLAALPDDAVVLLDGLVACAAPGVVTGESGRLRLVVLVHLPLADEMGLSTDEAAALDAGERATLQAAAAVVATSAGTARRLIGHHGLHADRVHVATPGVDTAPPATATADGGRLACVAAVTPRKGQDVLVEALARVGDLSWTCVLVGARGPDAAYLERLNDAIRAAVLGDRVTLAGPRTGAELDATYAGTDLLVLPSRAETYGMVVTEALARGIPVLASAADGVSEAVGHAPDGVVPGILVPAGDPLPLADALRHWLTVAPVRERLRLAARQRRETLQGWDTTSRVIDDVLRQLHRRTR